ncbi:MAG: NADH-quinone oxidoreductase subunit L [Candidatus Eutrophobiaceae bacterium]
MKTLCLLIVLLPLAGSLLAGLCGKRLGCVGSHRVTIVGMALSSLLSMWVYKLIVVDRVPVLDTTIYIWGSLSGVSFQVGFLVDALTATMMVVVTFVSWMIHIYSIGYMRGDPGYQRFFSYLSLFTFAMLMLVMANNFMQLFFGWEAVGLVSYLLIGFWYKKPSAIFANLKAFLVNRVGDFGFLLGIAAVLATFGTLDYQAVFVQAPSYAQDTIQIAGMPEWSLMSLICICLFVGAMGKSAQVPLHVWLPDSMEGPTPISALIHAATMVTAGIFMVARMSPLFELSATALNLILLVGSITALSMGLLGLVQNDIKRVIAYSTLSQLGYMTVALGASAYAAAIFHLVTHAFFKALLFLAAGSVIIGMHHEQDMRKMGELYKKMPITWLCCCFGTLSLIGFPGTAGFFSKDAIIEAVHLSNLPAAGFAYFSVLIGVAITALYSIRLLLLTFHGTARMDLKIWRQVHESPKVVTLPLLILAVPSLILGWFLFEPMLFGDYFGSAIHVAAHNDVLAQLGKKASGGPLDFVMHAFTHPKVLLLLAAGMFIAWWCYIKSPHLPERIAGSCGWLYSALIHKYGFDAFNQTVLATGTRKLGTCLWRWGDVAVIDKGLVHGLANQAVRLGRVLRHFQTGYLYHYAFAMIIGLLILLGLFVYRVLP